MMFNQLSLFTTLGVVILYSTQCATQATLFQKSTQVGLGVSDSMELVCSVTGSISTSSRVWTGGPGFSPIITNGVSVDNSKYTETLQTVDFSLHIHNVVVDDVCGVNYQCSNGFDISQTETIVLNSSIFSYVPKSSESEIQVQNEVYDNDMKMTILVNLTTVFPEPICKAELGTTDITSKLLSNSYNNGNCGLKSTELSINNETYDCSGKLVITCIVGSQSVTAYSGSPPCVVTTEGTRRGNNPCEGDKTTKIILGNTDCTPVGLQLIIVIIIIICDTQKVKIIVTAEKMNKKLKSAKQTINKGKEKTVSIKGNDQHYSIIEKTECSIDVRGGDSHECVFETDAGVLKLNFMIKDELLNVKPGSAITLPTILTVEPDYSKIQWCHNDKTIENDELHFHTTVTRSTYGVYGIKMTFDNLGLSILIKNMRVQARNWIVMMICVVVNVPLVLIGGGVTEYNRSTDGFCVDVTVTIIAFVVPIIVYCIPVVVFIYFFFLKRTGNEKSRRLCENGLCTSVVSPGRQEPANVVTTTSTTIGTSLSARTTTSSMGVVSSSDVAATTSEGVVSSSDVAATTSDDQDRRNRKPSKLPEGYEVKMPLKNIRGNDQILKENAEQINLLDGKL